VPIILLRKFRSGMYVPFAPVFVVEDRVAEREFLLALDESVRFLGRAEPTAPERQYAERMVRQRLHQAEFRGRVISAYETHCAICRLRHGELLDAAHITPDRDERGLPVVSNGLSLCKIHHAAFDQHLIGITGDYLVQVDHALLEEVDGPMLRHGLQEMHGTTLTLPRRRLDRPDPARLEERFAEFMRHAS
jgi:putative restriction endonuclease